MQAVAIQIDAKIVIAPIPVSVMGRNVIVGYLRLRSVQIDQTLRGAVTTHATGHVFA